MKPILFNTEMVRALLDGRKTVTRRVVKPKCKHNFVSTGINGEPAECRMIDIETQEIVRHVYPPYKSGDILYVRETFGWLSEENKYVYKASDFECVAIDGFKWSPSLHMPREAARIFLRVTDVRVEKLQDITAGQSKNEGVGDLFLDEIAYTEDFYNLPFSQDEGLAKEQFAYLWDSTVKKEDYECYGWNANPWVWVIEFERCEKP